MSFRSLALVAVVMAIAVCSAQSGVGAVPNSGSWSFSGSAGQVSGAMSGSALLDKGSQFSAPSMGSIGGNGGHVASGSAHAGASGVVESHSAAGSSVGAGSVIGGESQNVGSLSSVGAGSGVEPGISGESGVLSLSGSASGSVSGSGSVATKPSGTTAAPGPQFFVTGNLELGGNFDAILNNPSDKDKVQKALEGDIAKLLGAPSARILSMALGSLKTQHEVGVASKTDADAAAAQMNDLKNQDTAWLKNTASASGQTLTVIGSSATVEVRGTTAAPEAGSASTVLTTFAVALVAVLSVLLF